MVAELERKELATHLIAAACTKQGIYPDQLTLHADRGGPMTAKTVADVLRDLGVAKSHSRPHVPDDNPFSEAQFKTIKYRPAMPERFGSPQDARAACREIFKWYNHEHYHSALALMTPATVHYGHVERVQSQRQRVLDAAYAAHPDRFVNGAPRVPVPAGEVWINQPAPGLVPTSTALESAGGVALPARTAPVHDLQPGAQAGSTAAGGRAKRSVDAAQHSATAAGARTTEEVAIADAR
jgi:putative transposase